MKVNKVREDILPFKTFEKLITLLVKQRQAEEEIVSGFAKYNSTYAPVLEMPLTSELVEAIEELYEEDSEYPLLSWWLYEGSFDPESMTNKKAVIFYDGPNKVKKECKIETLFDLWATMEEDYKERKLKNVS